MDLRTFNQLRTAVRGLIFGALIAGILGGVVGLLLGLNSYWPTAWFAVLEVGIPAAMAGGIVGAGVGAVRHKAIR